MCQNRFFKIGVLKTLYTIQRKTTVSESPFNQPVACYFINKRLRHRRFLVDIAKLSRTPFLQEHLETPDSLFMEHMCTYNIKFNFNQPRLLRTHKYWNVMWNYSLSCLLILKNLLLSVVNSFMTEIPIIYETVHWFVQNSMAKY